MARFPRNSKMLAKNFITRQVVLYIATLKKSILNRQEHGENYLSVEEPTS